MARKKHNPGCPCCECYDTTFTSDYSLFTTAEGSYETDRWVLASGEELESGEKPSGAEAWFTTIHIKSGDCDLTWDGITFEYRDAGTITNGTHSSIFMPGSAPSAGWEETLSTSGTYLTLWVTPTWYAVMVNRERFPGANGPSTRGSIQIIDRDNTAAPKSIVITAVGGDLEIKSWRISDSTVSVEGGYMYGEITRECPKPDRYPACTERFFQSQQDLNTSITWSHEVDRYEIVRIVGGGSGGGDLLLCQYLDTVDGGLDLYLGSSLATGIPDISSCIVVGLNWLITGTSGSDQPNPNTAATFSQAYTLPDSEAATPYPKPQARYLFEISAGVRLPPAPCDSSATQDGESFVTYISDGTAAVMFDLELLTLSANYFDCFTAEQCVGFRDETSPPVLVTEELHAEWVAE